ncbi:MAG: hypothetical protein ABSD98_03665 [Candidatus Korobacteraceae bacterium]|jgi:hypothetical protein
MLILLLVIIVVLLFLNWRVNAGTQALVAAWATDWSTERKAVQEERERQDIARIEAEEERRFEDFYETKGFSDIFDKRRLAEFARQRGIGLDEAETILCAADALFDEYRDGAKALEAGERIAAFGDGLKEYEERKKRAAALAQERGITLGEAQALVRKFDASMEIRRIMTEKADKGDYSAKAWLEQNPPPILDSIPNLNSPAPPGTG